MIDRQWNHSRNSRPVPGALPVATPRRHASDSDVDTQRDAMTSRRHGHRRAGGLAVELHREPGGQPTQGNFGGGVRGHHIDDGGGASPARATSAV